jgi:hypothetical protein
MQKLYIGETEVLVGMWNWILCEFEREQGASKASSSLGITCVAASAGIIGRQKTCVELLAKKGTPMSASP